MTQTPARPPLKIVFPLYPGLTQLDFTGPHQVLSQLPHAQLAVASTHGGEIVSDDGLRFLTERLADLTGCDVLCVPGGVTCTDAMADALYMAEIKRLAEGARYVTSVCTGSLILAAAGLLEGRRAGCHWAWREYLTLFSVEPDSARVVRDGRFITGGGVTAGIDFALSLAAEIVGEAAAQAIQLGLEYAPAPPFEAGRPDLAPPAVLDRVLAHSRGMGERVAALAEAAARAGHT